MHWKRWLRPLAGEFGLTVLLASVLATVLGTGLVHPASVALNHPCIVQIFAANLAMRPHRSLCRIRR